MVDPHFTSRVANFKEQLNRQELYLAHCSKDPLAARTVVGAPSEEAPSRLAACGLVVLRCLAIFQTSDAAALG